MSRQEWESLCDGCRRCCLNKLEDEDTKEIFFTNVACRLLDSETCRCSRYRKRYQLVSDCVDISSAEGTAMFDQLPTTCAYRRIADGDDLEWWHPLVSGRAESVHEAGISVRGKTISEENVHPRDLEHYIVAWFK